MNSKGQRNTPASDADARASWLGSADAPPGVRVMDPSSRSSAATVRAFNIAGISAQHVDVLAREGFECGWVGEPHYLALHDLRNSDCEIFSDDRSVARERDLRGRLAFVPSGCHSWGWMVPAAGPQSFTALYFDAKNLEDDLMQRLQRLPLSPQVYFFDVSLRSTLEKIRACLTAETPPDTMYVESLCVLAAMELGRLAMPQEGEAGSLGGQMAERVVEYMRQNLGDDIALEDLARIAGLTRFHFVRAFRRVMNETPYQHLLRRRIDRAKELLRSDLMSIAQIALAVGFKNSTRFTAAFRRFTKCTPGEYRATVRR